LSSRRHVLIVGCGFPQLGLIRAARDLGFEVSGADLNPSAIGVPLVDHFLQASTGEVAAIASAFRASGATGIATSGSELALTTTAHAAELLGLPFYADTQTVHRCQAKDAMRAGYLAAGLPVPAFQGCTTVEQARSFVEHHGLPVVVKPAHGWGQRGVSRVDDASQLDSAFALACEMSHGGGGAVLEECIVGHEVSVNGWVEDGTLRAYCVTDREVFPGTRPLGVMRSEIAPTALPPDWVERAVDAARKGARALGLLRGPCYSQVAVDAHRAVLFETAARLGGGFDADVTRLYCGVDLYARLLGVAFQDRALEYGGVEHEPRPAMVRFLRPTHDRQMRLLSVDGLDRVRAMPQVVDVVVYPKPGDVVPPLVNAARRIGHILLQADRRDVLVASADAAEKALQLAYSPL